GLICGIASAIKALRPDTKIYASEIDTGAPFAPSLAAGRPVEVPFVPSFADGIGGSFLNDEMLDLARTFVDGAIAVDRAPKAAVRSAATARRAPTRRGGGPGRVRRRRRARRPGRSRNDRLHRLRRQRRRQDARDHPPGRDAGVAPEMGSPKTTKLPTRRASAI